MTHKAVVRARISDEVKEEAGIVLASIGLTISDAFRLLLTRVAHDKMLPFDPLIPNGETITAMKAARRGDVIKVKTPQDLLASLND